jgi:DNA-binding transcriptional ArsR family regulator
MKEQLSVVANLVGDPGRSAILLSLMGGIALPAGELASIANIAPQTASGHLAKLIDGGLLHAERQGRHRYYRLSSAEVADAMEALLVLSARPKPGQKVGSCKAVAGDLAYARTCYAHLAGWLGVQITQELESRGLLKPAGPKTYTIPAAGQDWFRSLGIELPSLGIELPSFDRASEKFARRCLDWTVLCTAASRNSSGSLPFAAPARSGSR